jgi:hypothetical protein
MADSDQSMMLPLIWKPSLFQLFDETIFCIWPGRSDQELGSSKNSGQDAQKLLLLSLLPLALPLAHKYTRVLLPLKMADITHSALGDPPFAKGLLTLTQVTCAMYYDVNISKKSLT